MPDKKRAAKPLGDILLEFADDRSSLDDLIEELSHDPEFVAESRRQNPFYNLARHIYSRRKELGLTVTEVAQISGTDYGLVSKLESADHNINLKTLIQVAEALDAEVEINLRPFFLTKDKNEQEIS